MHSCHYDKAILEMEEFINRVNDDKKQSAAMDVIDAINLAKKNNLFVAAINSDDKYSKQLVIGLMYKHNTEKINAAIKKFENMVNQL